MKIFDLLRDVLGLFVHSHYLLPSISRLDIHDLDQSFRNEYNDCSMSTYKSVLHEWRYKLNKSNVYSPKKTNIRINKKKTNCQVDRNNIAKDHCIFLFGFDKPPMCTIRCQTMNGFMSTFSMTDAHIEKTIDKFRISFEIIDYLKEDIVRFS